MFRLFNNKARKATAREIKSTIFIMRDAAKSRQKMHKTGSDYWTHYQYQINAYNDLIDKVNQNFNIN